MSVFNCPDCGGKVLTEVSACPHCGRPVRVADYQSDDDISTRRGSFIEVFATRRGRMLMAVLAVGLGFVAWNVSNSDEPKQPLTEQQAQKAPTHLTRADQESIKQALAEAGYDGRHESQIATGWVSVILRPMFTPQDTEALARDAVIAIRNQLYVRGYDQFRVRVRGASTGQGTVGAYGAATFTEAGGLNWDDEYGRQ